MSASVRRLKPARFCNHPVDGIDGSADRDLMIADAAKKLEELFDVLHIDHKNDHNTRDTPRRVARMLVEEILHGRYNPPPAITEFDNVERYDQLIVTGPLEVRSTCAHHMLPIYGEAYIGVLIGHWLRHRTVAAWKLLLLITLFAGFVAGGLVGAFAYYLLGLGALWIAAAGTFFAGLLYFIWHVRLRAAS